MATETEKKFEEIMYRVWGPEEEDYDWYNVVEKAYDNDPDVYYDTGVWTSVANAKAFWDEFKKNGFTYEMLPLTPSGDEAIDRLEAAGHNIVLKYLAYATKKSTDDPDGAFDYDDYIAWEEEYYNNSK
jgi:hypothetical protein